MTVRSERDALSRRFNKMKDGQGLLDMKFFLGETSEATVEQVCGDVNRVLDLFEAGKAREIESWHDKPRAQ